MYGSKELLAALKRIWFASDQMCSKKLVAVLPLWLPFYADAYGALRPEIEQQLRTLSAATIDRLWVNRCTARNSSNPRVYVPRRAGRQAAQQRMEAGVDASGAANRDWHPQGGPQPSPHIR